MESFLKSIERPAYRMALLACRNREDALDLVQDALCRFVDRYGQKQREEWQPLFYTILHNALRDLGRRRTHTAPIRNTPSRSTMPLPPCTRPWPACPCGNGRPFCCGVGRS